MFTVIKLVEVRKVAPDAFKLLLSDVAIAIRVKGFKYRLKNKSDAQDLMAYLKRISQIKLNVYSWVNNLPPPSSLYVC